MLGRADPGLFRSRRTLLKIDGRLGAPEAPEIPFGRLGEKGGLIRARVHECQMYVREVSDVLL